MKKIILSVMLMLPMVAIAASSVAITEKAPIDLSDHQSLQRGAKSFVNYCLNCHSAKYMRYNRLQDIGLTEKQIKENLLLAADKVGDTMDSAMAPEDGEKWFGAAPPDLSVIVRARGADWIYAYLRGFYQDDTRPTGWNNIVFDKVAMPHVLYELQGIQTLNHDTHALELSVSGKLGKEEFDAFAGDLTNYLTFMAEPGQQDRKTIGVFVLLFLFVLLVLAKKLKAAYWRDIK